MRLEVPYFKQFNEHACFVASVAMVLRFYGVRINQREVYSRAKVYDPLRKRRIWGCVDTKLMFTIKNTGYKMKSWLNYKKNAKIPPKIKNWLEKGYMPELKKAKKMGLIKVSRNASIKLIRQLLEKGIPVLAEVHSNTWFKTKKFPDHETHVVVITGYENGNLIVSDSYMSYLGKDGRDVEVSMRRFEKAWEAPPYFKNGLCVLVK